MSDPIAPVRPRRRRAGTALTLLLIGATLLTPGCATLPGLLTGAFTGAVDAPMQVYRYNRSEFNRTPIYWAFNVVVLVPAGIIAGPLAGLVKGIATDIQWLLGQTSYKRSMTTYRDYSLWRPFTIHWHHR